MKTCWMCKHFHFESGGHHFSDYTPGYDAKMECRRGVWEFCFSESTQAYFIECLATAQHCDEFQAIDEIVRRHDKK